MTDESFGTANSNNSDSQNIVERLRAVAHSIESNDPVPFSWGDVCRDAADVLQRVWEWATTYPDSDPKVTEPAQIGHFAGYQKGRETVRELLGLEEMWECTECGAIYYGDDYPREKSRSEHVRTR